MNRATHSDGLVAEQIRCHGVGPFTLQVACGECLCISGESGSGKSLLLRSLADMEPHEGAVSWQGTPASSVPGPEWRRRIGLLPAESEWWLSRVCDHFAGDDARRLLPEVGLGNALWQARISDLSTGERQRLALVRLLANRPEVLLLDEPTASLDPASTRSVEALIGRLRTAQGLPVVWVSHDPEQIKRVGNRHLRLDGALRAVPAP